MELNLNSAYQFLVSLRGALQATSEVLRDDTRQLQVNAVDLHSEVVGWYFPDPKAPLYSVLVFSMEYPIAVTPEEQQVYEQDLAAWETKKADFEAQHGEWDRGDGSAECPYGTQPYAPEDEVGERRVYLAVGCHDIGLRFVDTATPMQSGLDLAAKPLASERFVYGPGDITCMYASALILLNPILEWLRAGRLPTEHSSAIRTQLALEVSRSHRRPLAAD